MMVIVVMAPSPIVMAKISLRTAVPVSAFASIGRGRGTGWRRRYADRRRRREEGGRGRANLLWGRIGGHWRRRQSDGRRRPSDHLRQKWRPDCNPDVLQDTGLGSRNGSEYHCGKN
jgi:hypothetical protein